MPMLERIADDIWVVGHDLFTFGIHFPGRMTVIRLSDGGLWLHSPVPIDDRLADALAELGPVRHLVAPNCFHHVHLEGVRARYPEAKLWGAPGLDDKRKDLAFDATLGDEAPEAWGNELSQITLRFLPKFNEVVFFHERSATLIVTDLFMNVHACKGLLSRLVYMLEGTYRRMAVPRIFRFMVKDRAAAAEISRRIVALQPSTVVMAHGEVVHEQAGNQVARALSLWSSSGALPSRASA